MPQRLDVVDAAARESTRLAWESRLCRDGVVPTQECRNIRQAQNYVMERLFWPKPALIKAVSGDEAWIGSLIDSITINIKKALEPCEAYLECFKQWEQFLNLDVDAYVSNLKHAVPIRVEIKCTAPYGPVAASARRREGIALARLDLV